MTPQVCPYLRAVDDPNIYIPAADEANACDAVAGDGPADIGLSFQQSMCLGGQFGRCSRFREAERVQLGRTARRALVVGGSLGTLVLLAGCAVLAVLAGLALFLGGPGGARLGILVRATETPIPTTTPSPTPTLTPTMSSTPTEPLPTDTATLTPEPLPTTPVATPVPSPDSMFVSPLATTPLPAPTAKVLPTATRRPLPTATRRPLPTATRGPTLTPSITPTRMPTATPLITCRTGDTMTFNPASPIVGTDFIIEVRSLMGYTDVSLTGAGSPHFLGAQQVSGYYVWQWEDSIDAAGTHTYDFMMRSGAYTCVTKSVLVLSPTSTPSPSYDVALATVGDWDLRPIYTGTVEIFDATLTNNGNVTDTIDVSLDTVELNQGVTAQVCIGDACSASAGQVTLPQGGSQALSIKIEASAEAQPGKLSAVTLWVQSGGDPTKKTSQKATVVVTQ